MGSITFTGKSTDFDAVAAWLQTLARQEGYIEPTVHERHEGGGRGHRQARSTTSSPPPS